MASLVASFPERKALLETEEPTVRDFFLSYQERNRRAEFLAALDPTGRVIARTDSDSVAPIPDIQARWIEPVLRDTYVEGLLVTEDGAYIAAAVPAEAGGVVFGFILAVVLQSRERAMAPYRELQYGLLILGLLIAGVGVAGSAVLARTITAPVAQLVEGTKQVAAGNLDYHRYLPPFGYSRLL